jgi:diguanylate cyclase (GGDEF)-like protein
VVFYIFAVAALNLALGFGVAVYLGRRYRTAIPTGNLWSTGTMLGEPLDDVLAEEEEGVAAAAESLSARHSKGQFLGVTAVATAEEAPETTAGGPSGEGRPAMGGVRGYHTRPSRGGASACPSDGKLQPSATPQPDKSPSEQSVDDLRINAEQYQDQIAEADEKLRVCAEDPEAAEIEAILGSLMGSTQRYLENRNRAHGTFQKLHQGQAAAAGICGDLQAAIERQDREIENTSAMIEGFDYRSDLKEGCRQMANQTGRLIDSNGQLRNTLDEAKVKLAGPEPRLQEVQPPSHREDIGDTLPNGRSSTPRERRGPAELEVELLKWWNKQPHRAPELSLALIELDHAAQLEQRHGHDLAEKILHAVGQLLESGAEGGLVQTSQQRFFLLSPEADTRLAANTAERLRQTIKQAHLHHEGSEIRVTVSCAVVGTASKDTPNALTERAEATLQEAKRYGGNRTFLHDGKYPTPVVPPNFSLEEKQVTL